MPEGEGVGSGVGCSGGRLVQIVVVVAVAVMVVVFVQVCACACAACASTLHHCKGGNKYFETLGGGRWWFGSATISGIQALLFSYPSATAIGAGA